MKRAMAYRFVLIAAMALAGCAAPAPTASPQTKLKVAFSTMSTQPALMWVAKDAGFFDQNGLDVDLVFIDGGTKTAQALLSGDVQYAFLSPDSLVNANAGGASTVILAGLMNKPYYDLVVIPSIKAAADLKGQKVAVSGFSGSSYSAARIAVRDLLKLDPDKDVVMVATGNQQQREAALVSGQIQASVMDPDAELTLKKEGLVIFESLWNKDIPFQHNVIGANKAYVQEHPDTTTRVLKALIQATGYLRSPEGKDKVMSSMGKNLKTDDKDFLETAYNRMAHGVLQCAPYASADSMKTIIAESKAAVAKGMTVDAVVDNSFVRQLEESGFIKANCK